MNLESLGLSAPILAAGFAGGICKLALGDEAKYDGMWARISAMTSGLALSTLTAAYVTTVAARYLGAEGVNATELFGAWLVGLTAQWICKALILKARNWSPNIGNGSHSNGKSNGNGQ